jgi:hypothetical protein
MAVRLAIETKHKLFLLRAKKVRHGTSNALITAFIQLPVLRGSRSAEHFFTFDTFRQRILK